MNDSSLLLKKQKKEHWKNEWDIHKEENEEYLLQKKSENEEMSLFDIKRLHIWLITEHIDTYIIYIFVLSDNN